MEEGWENHVSPLMMGVGMGEMEGLGEMPPCGGGGHEMGGEMMPQHHQGMRVGHGDMGQDMHHDMERGLDMAQGIREHLVRGMNAQHDYFGQELLSANAGSSPVSGGGSLSPGGSAGLPGTLSPGGTSSTGPTQCCESGRPLMTDPVTGQSMCSCQYDSARLALQYPRGVSMYGTPYPSTDQNPYPSIGVESSAFYSPLTNPYALKETGATGTDMSAWTSAGLQPTTGYYPYDPALAYGYGAGYDLAARRKNATRESTATLKAWLNEHKKNPYPTKGEKIMLAIITKMTLTQVSTWFANARRRLKKENKMTWEPRNRVEDEDNNNEDDDHKSTDGKDLLDSKDSGTASSEDGDRPPHSRLAPDTASEWSESRPDSEPDSPECYDRPHHPAFLPPRTTSPPQISVSVTKPRIWSLADMASKEGESSPTSTASNIYSTSRLMPPMTGRLPPPGLHTSPYARPHEFYRSLYGPAAAQHLSTDTGASSDVSLLENYSRSIAAANSSGSVPSSLSSVLTKANLAAATSSSTSSLPLGLTTTSRMSPASSISSGSETPHKPMALNKA